MIFIYAPSKILTFFEIQKVHVIELLIRINYSLKKFNTLLLENHLLFQPSVTSQKYNIYDPCCKDTHVGLPIP